MAAALQSIRARQLLDEALHGSRIGRSPSLRPCGQAYRQQECREHKEADDAISDLSHGEGQCSP